MTYENLKSEVLALGFTQTLENEGTLLLMANRALRLLSSDFAREEEICLYRTYREPIRTYADAYEQSIQLREGECVAFCYRFRDGKITFANQTLPLSDGGGTYAMRAQKAGEFTLIGDAQMFAIAVYAEGTPLSLCEVDLPSVRYCLSDYVPNALVADTLPTDVYGCEIAGARCDGKDIYLPRTFAGAFFVRYEREPEAITKDTEEIDIESHLLPLFPLLVCAYLWLDDEPERAQYYMALYREGRERMLHKKPSHVQMLDSDILRWT